MKLINASILVASLVAGSASALEDCPTGDCAKQYIVITSDTNSKFNVGPGGKALGSKFFYSGQVNNVADVVFSLTGTNGNIGGVKVQSATSTALPAEKDGYFFDGECVATSAKDLVITAHSCLYNLCLGDDGCINIYAGSPFTLDVSAPKVDELAPPFPGTILGGTNKFRGIKGSVELVTVTGIGSDSGTSISQRLFLTTNFSQLPDVPP